MKKLTLRELHNKAIEMYGKQTVIKAVRKFYIDYIKADEAVRTILDDLNSRTNSRFKSKTKSTFSFISARLRDGNTVEDFIKVNKIMSARWMNTDNQQYLRPATLYNSEKFEGYLAEAIRATQKQLAEINEKKRQRQNDLSKENKTVRADLQKWDTFPNYQELWSYVGRMNDNEFKMYNMPDILRKMQANFLKLKLKGDSKLYENLYRELKENESK